MNYALGYAFNSDDLFYNFKSNKLRIDCVSLNYLYNDPHKLELSKKIFRDCCKIIINDIIDNDVEFQLPTGSRKSSIMMRIIDKQNFVEARQNGAFKNIDFLESGFTGYQLTLYMYGYERTWRTKRIYLNPELNKKIENYVNFGKTYSGLHIKTLKDYYLDIKRLYPYIPLTDIKKILNFGWKSLYLHNSYGGDTLIKTKDFWFYIGILRNDSVKHFNYYLRKLRLKLRILHKRKKLDWDGYYYFGLYKDEYEQYLSQQNKRGRPRKKYTFKNKIFYKLFEECNLAYSGAVSIFRTCFPTNMGYSVSFLECHPVEIEQVLEREPLKFKDILVINNDYQFK